MVRDADWDRGTTQPPSDCRTESVAERRTFELGPEGWVGVH